MTALDPKTANVRNQDAAAASYDDKWAISFDDRGRASVWERAERMLPHRRSERVLERTSCCSAEAGVSREPDG